MTKPNTIASQLLSDAASTYEKKASLLDALADGYRDLARTMREGDPAASARAEFAMYSASEAFAAHVSQDNSSKKIELIQTADAERYRANRDEHNRLLVSVMDAGQLWIFERLHAMSGCRECEVETAIAQRRAELAKRRG